MKFGACGVIFVVGAGVTVGATADFAPKSDTGLCEKDELNDGAAPASELGLSFRNELDPGRLSHAPPVLKAGLVASEKVLEDLNPSLGGCQPELKIELNWSRNAALCFAMSSADWVFSPRPKISVRVPWLKVGPALFGSLLKSL